MDFITITPEQLETMIRNAVSKALDLRVTPSELPDRCTFKEALEITGLSKSAMYKKTMDKAIPFKTFGNRLIFSRKELKEWIEVNTLSKSQKQTLLKLIILKTDLGKTETVERKTEKGKIMSYAN